MEINSIEKNNKINKELSTIEEVTLKTKLFTYFYYVLKKKDINILLCTLFLIFETIQFISYAFSDPNTKLWKINSDTMYYIQLIVTSARIAPLMKFISFNLYIVIWGCLLGIIFFLSLILAMSLRINKSNSKFYQLCVSFTRYLTGPLTIFFLIPIGELLLIMIKCENAKIIFFSDSIECWKGLHILYSFLSIIFSLLFYVLLLTLTLFYFDPFNSKKTSTKIDTNADFFLFIFKIVAIVIFIGLSSDWISIIILVIISLLNLKRAYENPTFNNYVLESIISIRNASIFWTYLVLLISKVLETSSFNGQIYLLLIGYPLIIIFSIIYYRKKTQNFMITNSNFNDANEILVKLKYFKLLIESFLSKNKSSKSSKSNNLKKNEILLKGYITIHEETCVTEECPLKKFLANPNNFNIQKMSLLHYMNIMFNEGIKKFPNSKMLMMNFVQFNYEKKYNLNSAKTYLTKLEKSQNTLTEDFIIYCIKQNINNSNNKLNKSFTNEDEMTRIEDTTEHKFKRLKLLIETSTKLYGEFWGSLSNNLTVSNNLNLKKLFFVGNKLNQILTEINLLWENDLKMKKIDLENQSIVQLYAYFLREILKNKKKSEEISKKLNEEQHYENKKNDGDRLDLENLDLILENQDLVIYSRTNEKGECQIIQCSNSIIAMFGYSKLELIGKKIEFLMPTIYQAEHYKILSQKIKNIRSTYNLNKDIFKNTEKKQFFILPKNKVGYIVPINSRFTIYNDDDFSNTFIIKSKFELKDTKSVYAFYILCKEDFNIESISSSCLNLNLSMDILKKYVISLNVLLRNELNDEVNFAERFTEYEEEPKRVVWIYPDILYPKNENMDINSKTDFEKEELIQSSQKKEFNLLITRIKFREDETLGYCFRLTNLEQRRQNQENVELRINYNPNRMLMYDMGRLNYMRTVLVTQKTKNLEPVIFYNTPEIEIKEQSMENSKNLSNKKSEKKKRKRDDSSDTSNDEEKKIAEDNIITKEKLQELSTKNMEEIKNYINTLMNFGDNVSYFKRDTEFKNSYEDHYHKFALIKHNMDEYIKKQANKKSNSMERKSEKQKNSDGNNFNTYTDSYSSSIDFASDATASLNNIFNDNSITNIKYFSFIMFLLLCTIISVEFIISINIVENCNDRIFYSEKAYKILNSILYTKFFLTEAVLAQDPNYVNIDKNLNLNNTVYIIQQMSEMSNYHQLISETYSFFSNATITFSDEYYNYYSTTQLMQRILSNDMPSINTIPFSSLITQIYTTIFGISNVNNNWNRLVIAERSTYDLMYNLLNDYLTTWRELTLILIRDVKSHTSGDSRLIIIFGCSFVISVISLVFIKRLIGKFIDDREKPIDLFLTIKKQKFEELKFSSEAFLNKLLNKFFGNEESEEEMLSDSAIKIKPDEINIAKFKLKNEYKQSTRTSSEYLLIFIRILLFFIIFQAYMIFKYIYITDGLNNIDHFADVFNTTQYTQSDVVLSTNIAKQFLYNPTIPIFNRTDTQNIFNQRLVEISNLLEQTIKTTYANINYLDKSYMEKFVLYLNRDICPLANQIITTTDTCNSLFLGTMNYGFKAVAIRYFELLRYLGVENSNLSNNDILNSSEFYEINIILKHIIRGWFKDLLNVQMTSFTDYLGQIKLINVSTYIVLIVSIIIIYFLVWKNFEEKLKELLKTSVDLINLIPESFKYIIVQKINEEEDKKD